jgi:PKD repeat protein
MKKTPLLLIAAAVMVMAACTKEAPVAQFSTERDTYKLSEAVTFVNLTAGGKTCRWEFGDGDTSNLENPVHTFKAAGSFGVKLIATNSGGSGTYTDSLHILPDLTGMWYTTLKYAGGFGGFSNQQTGTMNLKQKEDFSLAGSFVYNEGNRTANLQATSKVEGSKVSIDFDTSGTKLRGTVNGPVTAMSGTFSTTSGQSGTWSATKL